MAWVAGADVTTGDLITAAQWNNYMGVAGSLDFLKAAIDDCVMRDGTDVAYASPAGARAKGNIYQNTSGKIREVAICITGAAVGDGGDVDVENANPPTTRVAQLYVEGAFSTANATFFVPPGSYYRLVEVSATITVSDWIEWDIL